MSEDPIRYSAAPTCLTPVLQIPREELRRGVRDTLFALHQERVWKQGQPGEDCVLAQIEFWEAVLGWLQQQRGTWVNLVGPKRD